MNRFRGFRNIIRYRLAVRRFAKSKRAATIVMEALTNGTTNR